MTCSASQLAHRAAALALIPYEDGRAHPLDPHVAEAPGPVVRHAALLLLHRRARMGLWALVRASARRPPFAFEDILTPLLFGLTDDADAAVRCIEAWGLASLRHDLRRAAELHPPWLSAHLRDVAEELDQAAGLHPAMQLAGTLVEALGAHVMVPPWAIPPGPQAARTVEILALYGEARRLHCRLRTLTQGDPQ